MRNLKQMIYVLIAVLIFYSMLVKGQSISLGTVAAELSDTVLVPLNFSNLSNVGAITLFIHYDPSSITYLGLENISQQASGILGNGGFQPMINAYAIGLIWITPGSSGVDFPSGKVLDLKLAFVNTNAGLDFLQFYCEILDWNDELINVSYTNGGIFLNQGASISTWNGNGNWSDESNWSNGIPGMITRAIINSGEVNITSSAICGKLQINPGAGLMISPNYALSVFDSLNISGTMVIQSDVSGTGSLINNGVIMNNGTINVERYLSSGDHFVSSPVQNATAGIFSNSMVYRYNEPTHDWEQLSANSPLSVTQGYKVSGSINSVTTFEGNLNYGDYTVAPLTFNPAGGDIFPAGTNLIGNPYPSAIGWNAGTWTKTNINSAIYLWNGTQYVSWNGEIGALDNGIIPSAQGFLVIANQSNPNIIIPNNSRLHNNQEYYKDFEKEKIANLTEIVLAGNDYEDRAFFQFKFESTLSFDPEYDAYKFPGLPEAPQLYSFTADGIKTSINVVPEIDVNQDTAITIGISLPSPGEYTLSFLNTLNFIGGYDLYLKDKEIDSLQQMANDSVYVFNGQQGTFDNRFALYFKKPAGINYKEELHSNLYFSNGVLCIELDSYVSELTVELFDIQGKKLVSAQDRNCIKSKIGIPSINSGIYIVRVSSGGKIQTKKLFVK